jgi:hypothetical protein
VRRSREPRSAADSRRGYLATTKTADHLADDLGRRVNVDAGRAQIAEHTPARSHRNVLATRERAGERAVHVGSPGLDRSLTLGASRKREAASDNQRADKAPLQDQIALHGDATVDPHGRGDEIR